MVPNVDLLIVQKHPINTFDSCLGCFSCLIMDITIATRTALFVGGDLAR
jgi:hypothetical protein